jgi:hypothetical protein
MHGSLPNEKKHEPLRINLHDIAGYVTHNIIPGESKLMAPCRDIGLTQTYCNM